MDLKFIIIKTDWQVYIMIDISLWMDEYIKALNQNFSGRVWFAGLQGSYSRGEATETSDIDVVVILDELKASDIEIYKNMLDTLPHRELACGFLSGKNEITNWEPSDLLSLYYDTMPIIGSLDDLKSLIDQSAVDRAIKIGACNIYHGCVHNMLYEKSDDILRGLYKSASFVVQAICLKQTGEYVRRQKDLLDVVSTKEKEIIKIFLAVKNGEKVDFNKASETLFNWIKKWI